MRFAIAATVGSPKMKCWAANILSLPALAVRDQFIIFRQKFIALRTLASS
jgi:hypothetical protein